MGTISSTGLYTAPASIATAQTVTVRATSVADATKSATAAVTLYPPLAVTMTPGTTTLYGSQTQQFSATVANAANTEVTWSVSPSVGTISSTGLYIAPDSVTTPQTVTVRATSVADISKSATATVSLLAFQPVLASPANGNTAMPLNTTLTWNVVAGASFVRRLLRDLFTATTRHYCCESIDSGRYRLVHASLARRIDDLLLADRRQERESVQQLGNMVVQHGRFGGCAAVCSASLLAASPIRATRAAPFGGPQIAGGATRSFTIPNSACGVPSTAQAYSLNVAVVPAGPLGYVTLWAAGQSQPVASTLNSLDGRVKSNAAIVPAGTGGAINVFASDATDLVLDINGYFVPATDPAGLAFYPITPCRAADTRNPTAALGGPSLAGGKSPQLPDPGRLGMQYSGVRAGLLAQSGGDSERTARISDRLADRSNPAGGGFTQRADRRCYGECRHRAGGKQRRYDVFASNDTDLVIDVTGYFAPAATGALSLFTMPACRVLDASQPGGTPRDVPAGDNCGIPSGAQAYVLSATVVPAGALGYLTLVAARAKPADGVDVQCAGWGGHIEPGNRAHIQQKHQRVRQQSNSPGAGHVRILRAVMEGRGRQ